MNDSAAMCGKAFANVVDALKPNAYFPDNVFKAPWYNFLFFDAEALIFGPFTWTVKELLAAEHSNVASLVNLSRKSGDEFDEAACICLDKATSREHYLDRLTAGGSFAWLHSMDNYGCASEVGDWCIYCETQSDVAVIAMKTVEMMKLNHTALRILGARPADQLWEPGSPLPVSEKGQLWRQRVASQYTPSVEKERFRWWAGKPHRP